MNQQALFQKTARKIRSASALLCAALLGLTFAPVSKALAAGTTAADAPRSSEPAPSPAPSRTGLPVLVVGFKRQVYNRLLEVFAEHLG